MYTGAVLCNGLRLWPGYGLLNCSVCELAEKITSYFTPTVHRKETYEIEAKCWMTAGSVLRNVCILQEG